EQARQQTQTDQAFPGCQHRNRKVRRDCPEAQDADGAGRQVLSRAEAGEKLEHAEPEKDDPQANARDQNAVARHPVGDSHIGPLYPSRKPAHLGFSVTLPLHYIVLDFTILPAASRLGEIVSLVSSGAMAVWRWPRWNGAGSKISESVRLIAVRCRWAGPFQPVDRIRPAEPRNAHGKSPTG